MKSVIVEAYEIAAAVEKGASELGVDIEDVEFEILSNPKTSWFGLKRLPAKVRVTLQKVEEPLPPQHHTPKSPNVKSPYTGANSRSKATEKPAVERRVASLKNKENSEDIEAVATTDDNVNLSNADAIVDIPQKEGDSSNQELSVQTIDNTADKPSVSVCENAVNRANCTKEYLLNIARLMNVDGLSIEISRLENKKVDFNFQGENANQIIGHRGETLDALQLLGSVFINNFEGEFIRFALNSDNYRQQREKALKSLATRIAKQALRTGRVVKLEPMSSYERKIIHAIVSSIDGVNSISEGEDWGRHIVIIPEKRSVEKKTTKPHHSSKSERHSSEKKAKLSDYFSDTTASKIDDSEFLQGASLGVPLIIGNRDEKDSTKTDTFVGKQKSSSSELYSKIMPENLDI